MPLLYKKLVALSLVLIFITSPLVLKPKKAEAQVGISAYLGGLAPAIAQLPLCKEKISNMLQGLFRKGGAGDAFDQHLSADQIAGRQAQIDYETMQEEAESKASAVETYDAAANKKLDRLEQKSAKIEKSVTSDEENNTCLKSIGRMVIKMVLQKMTMSTVAWIQGGFNGAPAFIQNPGNFFRDIAKDEILRFGAEIVAVNPFGKDWLRRQAEMFNKKFQDNARYSFNELLQNTDPALSDTAFYADFSMGGWDAWTFLTSVPANNPLGFQLMASNEMRLRLEGTWQSEANELRDALEQAGGYLGDYRCADPKNLSKEDHQKALEEGQTDGEGNIIGVCNRWEYVTPGKMVAEAATTAINYPNNNLLKAEDLNDAVAAILDALLAKFSSDLMNRGFADFSNEGQDGSYIINESSILTGAGNQTESDFSSFQLGSSFLQERPNFNIRTDITQALIDEQRIYSEKLKEQNSVLKDLLKTVYQLDYCIPGPHPGFELDSRRVLSAVQDSWVSKTPADMEDISKETLLGLVKAAGYVAGAVIGAAIGQTVLPIPGLGAAIGLAIGALVGWLSDLLGGPSNEEKLERYYGNIVELFSGLPMNRTYFREKERSLLRNKHQVTTAFDTMLSRYIDMIHKYYVPEFLPTVAKDAAKEFRKTQGYMETIKDNEDKVILMNGVIKRLADLKDRIDNLNSQYDPGSDEYENALEPAKSEFSRLAYNLISGNDIANVDNLTKKAKDQIKYVYNDLLTGEYGCEKDLELNRQPVLPANPAKTSLLKETARIPYPAEIWYDYNKFNPNEQFPIPAGIEPYTDKTEGNRMPGHPVKSYGPGFLSSVIFNYSINEDEGAPSCDRKPLEPYWLDCFIVSDLFNHINADGNTVGRNDFPGYRQELTSFEQTIGVY